MRKPNRVGRSGQSAGQMNKDGKRWLDSEVAGCDFQDARLGKRFRTLLENLWRGMGESILFACQDWANTKAAYRFFSNDRVSEQDILSGHFDATRTRVEATHGPVLVLHDTTEFTYKREQPDLIGMIGKLASRQVCGILMHSSLAVGVVE